MTGLIVVLGLILLIGPILGIVAFLQLRSLRREFDAHRASVDRRFGAAPQAAAAAPQPGAPSASEATEPEAPEAAPAEAVHPPEEPVPQPAAPMAASVPNVAPFTAKAPAADFEEDLTSRWLVWIGGLALALAGTFLVKYSIDQGLLGPTARVSIGFVAGLGLVAAGEWVRRRPLQQAVAKVKPDYVPPALSAGGLVTAFASVYAAYGLYGLVPPGAAFIALALLSFAALALSLWQGPLVAALGLIGSFVTPALVSTGGGSAGTLFSYLFFVAAAAFAVPRYRPWWWLGHATTAGAALWLLVWLDVRMAGDDMPVLAGFALAITALALFLTRRDVATAAAADPRGGLGRLFLAGGGLNPALLVPHVAAVAMTVMLLAIMSEASFGPPSAFVLGAHLALLTVAGWRFPSFTPLIFASTALIAASMIAWPLALAPFDPAAPDFGSDYDRFMGTATPYLWVFGALGTAGAVAGFLAIPGSARAGLWAAFSGSLPLILLAVGYARITELQSDWRWGMAALGVAVLALAAADRMIRIDRRSALAAFAVVAPAAVALAFAFTLREAWLSAALAALVPILAAVYDRERLPALRAVALVVAGIVLARLTLNWWVLGYAIGPTPVFNWILYGYGVPILCFWYGARLFARAQRDLLVDVLEGGAFALFVYFTTLEIRHWVGGGILDANYGLFEASLQTLNWLTVSFVAYLRAPQHQRPVLIGLQRILFALAATHLGFVHLVGLNPLFENLSVGAWPIFNTLFVAYGLPAALLAAFAFVAARRGEQSLAQFCGVSALMLGFFYVSVEVRHAFQGPRLAAGRVGDGELYAYSATWLVYCAALIAAGFRWQMKNLRLAGLIFLMLIIGKVFLIDMSELRGLYRVISFFGLGLALVGLGYVYRRFFAGQADRAAPPPGSAAA